MSCVQKIEGGDKNKTKLILFKYNEQNHNVLCLYNLKTHYTKLYCKFYHTIIIHAAMTSSRLQYGIKNKAAIALQCKLHVKLK